MADRGFTIKDMLQAVGAELNIPPFLEGRQQLPAGEVQEGIFTYPCGESNRKDKDIL